VSPNGYWRGCGRVPPSSPSATFTRRPLSWLRALAGNTIVPLGVDRFGQSDDIPDLYRAYGIDSNAILDPAARACLTALWQTE
jgi:pyruvate dehydrogenase complex dehydrogenase (E1) component